MPARPAVKSILALVAFVGLLNFVTMPAEEYVGDGIAVRIETIGVMNDGQWAVPSDVAHEWGARGQYFYENSSGAFYPKYGILNTLIYAPCLWAQKIARSELSLDSDNTLSLNLFNIVLGCATAAYLALLARRYTNSNVTMSIFVIAALYSTFWWNYLRAQTFEIYLTLFLLAFYYHLVSAWDCEQRGRRNRQLVIAAFYLGLLCLSKTVYAILLPIVVSFFALTKSESKRSEQLLWFGLPLSIFLCLLLASNWYKFGSPFNTGYTQWSEEARPFTVNLLPGFVGFLASKQGSVFLHFPVLLFALIGWPIFFKNRKREAILIAGFGAALFLVSSAFTNWKGEACYGPRYLLPVLPLVSLPFVHFLDWLGGLTKAALKWLLRGVVTVSLAYSFLLQVGVNSLPFFFWYGLLPIAEENSAASNYLDAHHFGTINIDFIRDGFGCPSRFRTDFINKLGPEQFVKLEGLRAETELNYYWLRKSFKTPPLN